MIAWMNARLTVTRLTAAAVAAVTLAVTLAGAAVAAEVPRFWETEWPQTDFTRAEVPFAEIVSAGPPKDGIPAIDAPRFLSVRQASRLHADREPVMSVEIGGEARAYPLRVMIWHGIVNDTVARTPIAVTYCPLCNSGVVYDRRIDGAVTTFGTTGKLRKSDLVMYDRATESWWQQFEGRALVGAKAGRTLDRVPSRLESFAEFEDRHPNGKVLVPENPEFRRYGANPYVRYDSSRQPFRYSGEYNGPGSPVMRVVSVAGKNAAWSLELLRQAEEIEIGDITITWTPGQASALDARQIAEGRDVGNVTVTRRLPDGSEVDVAYDVPFAFAFEAFRPGAPIHHVSRTAY
ncbi:MAG: DUF3179 domain-containing protein [Pseudomonadota bacterium]